MNYLFTAAVGLAILTIISAGGNSFVDDSTIKPITQQATSKSTDDEFFDAFKLKFKKKYATPVQENKAKTTYLENKAKTDAHNLRYAQGLVSFDVGIHENSDLTFEELSRLRRPNIALQSLNFIRANREPVTEEQLKSVIDNNGIITATMDTADNSLFSYKSGVYSCENTELKLQMEFLIIDYGTENNIDYWLCQTSWGTSFGQSGLIKIVRRDTPCGINAILM